MSRYPNGASALADARLRVSALGANKGIVMLEGRDDAVVFSGRVGSLESLIACGNKRILREALDRAEKVDRERILFVADCDYDVPAGRLRPGCGLILTRHTDREADFVQLGVIRGIVLRAIPAARASDAAADAITADVIAKAVQLAEVTGQLRYVAATQGIPFSFGGLKLRRYRRKSDGAIELTAVIDTVRQRSVGISLTSEEITQLLDGCPAGAEVCHGKDLIQAVTAVIHQDYGVSLNELDFIPELFRSVEDSVFEAWEVVSRIRQWEATTGVRLLG
jgi:hypothetical protein